MEYFSRNPAPFQRTNNSENSPPKRMRLDVIQLKELTAVSDYDILIATYSILNALPKHFKSKWNWSKFYKYLFDENDQVKW